MIRREDFLQYRNKTAEKIDESRHAMESLEVMEEQMHRYEKKEITYAEIHSMRTHIPIGYCAPPAMLEDEKGSNKERNKCRAARLGAVKEAIRVQKMQAALLEDREGRWIQSDNIRIPENQNEQMAPVNVSPNTIQRERELMEARISQFKQEMEADMLAAKGSHALTDLKEEQIKYHRDVKTAGAMDEYAMVLPAGNAERTAILRQKEDLLLKSGISLLKQQYKADLKAAKHADGYTDLKEKDLKKQLNIDIAGIMDKHAKTLPAGSRERSNEMKKKEELLVEANRYKKWISIENMKEGNEKNNARSSYKWHGIYEIMQKAFRDKLLISTEEAEYSPHDGQTLTNAGRAFFGGTKPMYIFEDRNDARVDRQGKTVYKRYLFKEAVNCCGKTKTTGAIVTEAASKLQEIVCPDFNIPAFCARSRDGKVIGSFQNMEEETKDPNAINLFSWQANPTTDLPQQTKNDLLREHALDWLLCNFDTKGENFLNKDGGRIISFDKESSFQYIKAAEAEHMSTTYRPHKNDTIYNVLFRQFAEGMLDLDLEQSLVHIRRMEDMEDSRYLELFKDMLDHKYERGSESRKQMEERILSRKRNLRAEYERFYSELLVKRSSHVRENRANFDPQAQTYRFAPWV